MFKIIQTGEIEDELNKLNSVTLDAISCIRLMNRIEIKYVFAATKLADLVNLLGKQYQVLEISNLRILPYSTTYLDTEDYLFYNQHVRGEFSRYKIRYRKYMATDESFLEIKKKTNKGRSIKYRIENQPLPGSFDSRASDFILEYLPVASNSVKPALTSRFSRITLAGFEQKERITLDFNIVFSDPTTAREIFLPHLAIAELKKEAYSDPSLFKSLIKQLNIYPAGFSKFCIGFAFFNDTIKKNMIKPRLLLINKLEDEYNRSDITG